MTYNQQLVHFFNVGAINLWIFLVAVATTDSLLRKQGR